MSLDQLTFLFIIFNYACNRVKYKTLYVIAFLFQLPCNTINHVARRKCKNMFSRFQVISVIISFLVAVVGFETSRFIKGEYLYELKYLNNSLFRMTDD